MPFRHAVSDDPAYIHVWASGLLSPDNYLAWLHEYADDVARQPHLPTLFEIADDATVALDSEAEGAPAGANAALDEAVAEAGALLDEARGGVPYRVAIAGGSADLRSFLAMSQEIVHDEAKSRSFERVAPALAWLCE